MCTRDVASEVLGDPEAQKPIHLIFFPPQIFADYLLGKKMPKVKRSRKAPPDGWELIEPTLDELDQKMREGELWSSCLGGLCPKNKWEETGCTTEAA